VRKTSTAAKIPQDLLNLAGEFRVCSELYRRRIYAAITYGNRKSVDIYAFRDDNKRGLRIEVKTSQTSEIPTRIYQKWKNPVTAPDAPDFWVLAQIRDDGQDRFSERFFVLTHKEICEKQHTVNNKYDAKYYAKNGKHFDFSKGMDKLRVEDVEEYEGKWSKIADGVRPKGSKP